MSDAVRPIRPVLCSVGWVVTFSGRGIPALFEAIAGDPEKAELEMAVILHALNDNGTPSPTGGADTAVHLTPESLRAWWG